MASKRKTHNRSKRAEYRSPEFDLAGFLGDLLDGTIRATRMYHTGNTGRKANIDYDDPNG
jgi:hypothetical protein